MLEIEYEFREKDLIHYNESKFANVEQIQKDKKRNMLMIPGFIILVGLFYWLYLADIKTGLYIIAIAVFWILVSPQYHKWDLRRQVLTHYTDREKVNMFGQFKLKIEPKMLVEKSPSGKNTMDWEELLRVERTKDYVYIYLDIDVALIIPRETTKGNLDEFVDQVEKLIERYDV